MGSTGRIQLRALSTGDFLDRADNILAFGLPGTGKTHAACALAHELILRGRSVLFTPTYQLVQELLIAKRDLEPPRALVARRYERTSTMLTTNQAVTQWGHVFGDDVLATAILDLLLHHAHTLTISGESYRLKQKRKAGFFGGSGGTKQD